jgi:hypothetical protein
MIRSAFLVVEINQPLAKCTIGSLLFSAGEARATIILHRVLLDMVALPNEKKLVASDGYFSYFREQPESHPFLLNQWKPVHYTPIQDCTYASFLAESSAPISMLLYFAPSRDPDRLLVFTHFPKTSSTSITNALQAALNRLMAEPAHDFRD